MAIGVKSNVSIEAGQQLHFIMREVSLRPQSFISGIKYLKEVEDELNVGYLANGWSLYGNPVIDKLEMMNELGQNEPVLRMIFTMVK